MKEYFLDRDNDCHWYIVPQEIRAEWDEWINLDSDDERSWNPPDGAIMIDNPNSIVFSDYRRV